MEYFTNDEIFTGKIYTFLFFKMIHRAFLRFVKREAGSKEREH